MSARTRTYKDLAKSVELELKKRGITNFNLEAITSLFEPMYFASLRTDESEPISFHIVYLDPDDPDPDPPRRITNDRWKSVRFEQPILATISNLIKVAKASDPRTSSLAIYEDTQRDLFVWGLVDQGNTYSDFVNYESESGPCRPGLFQASIVGIGHVVAFIEMQKIAELKINELITSAPDVLWGGPIHDALAPGINSYLTAVKRSVSDRIYQARDHWDMSLEAWWIESLCRLLLRLQKYRHGGAILVVPGQSSRGLNIKYGLQYNRLSSALERRAALSIQETHARDQIWEDYLDEDADDIPSSLYLDESVAQGNLEDNRREMDGTIWFISLLTRVDGLVLLNQRLAVRGFGVEITYSEEPQDLFLAGNRNGTKAKLRKLDYNHYGTRHRSMMRYCSKMPGSVGFVVSQDGDVRAMTKVGRSLIMWENIKLQVPDFIRQRRKLRTG